MTKTLKVIIYSVVIGTIVAGTSLGVTSVEFEQSPFWLSKTSEPLLMFLLGIGLIGLAGFFRRLK